MKFRFSFVFRPYTIFYILAQTLLFVAAQATPTIDEKGDCPLFLYVAAQAMPIGGGSLCFEKDIL